MRVDGTADAVGFESTRAFLEFLAYMSPRRVDFYYASSDGDLSDLQALIYLAIGLAVPALESERRDGASFV